MRRLRTSFVLASIGTALFAGLGSPASAAAAPGAAATSTTNAYQFGVYYTLEACEYFGNSLVQGGAFSSYNCVLGYYPSDGQYHWYLYVS